MKQLTIQHLKVLIQELTIPLMEWNEPIPHFDTRYSNVLESCLAQPFATFGKRDLYPTLQDKAAVLFYLMIKNHPFKNGNKRIAVTALLVFLMINNHYLLMTPEHMYDFALWIAKSPAEGKDGTLDAIKTTIKKNSVTLKKL